jgi:transposase-like protein
MVAEAKNPTTLLEAARHFTPEAAESFVRSIKWPDGSCCPKCGTFNVGPIKSRRRYQCREKLCYRQFSLISDTIMEGTHLTLDKWCLAVWQIANCRNGISSCEVARAVGIKQQSGWHLLHRIRHVLAQDPEGMMGVNGAPVEADSTFVGGLVKFMTDERRKRMKQAPHKGKSIVHAMKDRSTGKVRASVVPDLTRFPIADQFTQYLAPGARLYTDSHYSYQWTPFAYRHKTVNHSAREYVRGDVHCNGAENFFNCLRRGLKGTYIRATAEHLQPYVDEAVFRFNHRYETEWERFVAAMRHILGARLTYSELTDGAKR